MDRKGKMMNATYNNEQVKKILEWKNEEPYKTIEIEELLKAN